MMPSAVHWERNKSLKKGFAFQPWKGTAVERLGCDGGPECESECVFYSLPSFRKGYESH